MTFGQNRSVSRQETNETPRIDENLNEELAEHDNEIVKIEDID